MAKGTVSWFNDKKGYGFIRPADGGRDLFLHRTALECIVGYRTIVEGTPVEFEIIDEGKGPRAAHVRPLPSTALRGIVQCFNDEKGFGFIHGNDGREVYFHRTQIQVSPGMQNIAAGQEVLFEVSGPEQKPLAAKVRPAASAPAPVAASEVPPTPAGDPIPKSSKPVKQRACKTRPADGPPIFVKVDEIIRKYFSQPNLQIRNIAKVFGIGASRLSTVYHRQSGKTFQEALLSYRMDRAKELLNGKLPVRKIAALTGFKKSSYFSGRFRLCQGVTPGEYRINCRTAAIEQAADRSLPAPIPPEEISSHTRRQQAFVRRIHRILQRDFHKHTLQVKDLAREIGVHYTSLARRYHRLTGKTLTESLLKYRMNRAKELLMNLRTPIARVAALVGFKTKTHFITKFHRYHGVTTTAYREQISMSALVPLRPDARPQLAPGRGEVA